MYISCQTREGHFDEFFKYENQPFLPALADEIVFLRLGNKSELLRFLVDGDMTMHALILLMLQKLFSAVQQYYGC